MACGVCVFRVPGGLLRVLFRYLHGVQLRTPVLVFVRVAGVGRFHHRLHRFWTLQPSVYLCIYLNIYISTVSIYLSIYLAMYLSMFRYISTHHPSKGAGEERF